VGPSDQEHAARLEFGGRDKRGRYLPPHPYARPAEEIARPIVDALMAEIPG
jgi:hypothetical protein